jgi:glutamine amidotransferase
MCRHLAYLGPPVAVRSLLFDAPRALVRQAREPRLQNAGTENPDGWGVAYAPPAFERYRTATPMWEDAEFDDAPTAETVIAAARYASPGSEQEVANVAPFVGDGWAFSLNGVVRGFRDGFGDELRDRVSTARASALAGDTDAEVLFALILDRLDTGTTPGEALADVTRIVRARSDGGLNLLLTDGKEIAATAVDNSLFLATAGALVVASEPLDESNTWRPVDNGSLVENDRVTPIAGLDLPGAPP